MYTELLFNKYKDRIITRDFQAQKGDYGKLLVIGGSRGMAGAAYLQGLAAFRSGIGMVRFYGPECNRMILQSLLPEAMYSSWQSWSDGLSVGSRSMESAPEDHLADLKKALSWADYITAGSGLSKDRTARAIVHALLESDLSEKKLVLFDADALNILSDEGLSLRALSEGRKDTNIVVTPHVGEMSRLTGKSIREIKNDPAGTAASFSKKENCVTVLKDAVTYISSPSGEICENNSGHACMAKAGSGDVLAGVIAGVTAVIREDVFTGAAAADYIHGKAGEKAAEKYGEHGTLARDIANEIGNVMR